MENKVSNLPVILLVVIIVLLFWGFNQHNKKTMLEWDIETYKERLRLYEDSTIVENIIDSVKREFGEEMANEDKANRTR